MIVDFGLKLILVDYQHKLSSKNINKNPSQHPKSTHLQIASFTSLPCLVFPIDHEHPALGNWKNFEHGRSGRQVEIFVDFPGMKLIPKVIPRSWYCWWFRNPANSPGEVGSWSHYLQEFFYLQNGGWPWDFWTINSTFDGGWCLLVT